MSNGISIRGEEAEEEECKYLGVHLRNQLDWRHKPSDVFKKTEKTLLLEEACVLQDYTCISSTSLSARVQSWHLSQWLQETDQTDNEVWFCSGDCSRSGADYAKEDIS